MDAQRSLVSAVTALAFFVQATGLAHATAPQAEVQPAPNVARPPVPASPPPPPPSTFAPPPGSALAPPALPGGDVIYLKDGGLLRGRLLEILPNDHATLQLPTGQNAIVKWRKIDGIERQFAQAPSPGVLLPPTVAGSAIVHMDADPGVTLESIAPGSERWELACTTPCDAELPLANPYRVAGPNVRPSRPFGITASPGQHVVLTISAGSKGASAGGIALMAAGGVAASIGLLILVFSALDAAGDPSQPDEGASPDRGPMIAGVVLMLAGVGMVIGGVVLRATSKTTETQTMAALAPKARHDTAWLRAPMWRDTARDSGGLPTAMGFPIFMRSF
jgi:hypothetical protein